jgi:hypothetical protein
VSGLRARMPIGGAIWQPHRTNKVHLGSPARCHSSVATNGARCTPPPAAAPCRLGSARGCPAGASGPQTVGSSTTSIQTRCPQDFRFRRVSVHRLRDGCLATRRAPSSAASSRGGRLRGHSDRRTGAVLRCAARSCRDDRTHQGNGSTFQSLSIPPGAVRP